MDEGTPEWELHVVLTLVSALNDRWVLHWHDMMRRERQQWLLLAAMVHRAQAEEEGMPGVPRHAWGLAIPYHPQRRWWVRPRKQTQWWQEEVLGRWGPDLWLYHFRMTKETLFEIADLLRPHLQRQDTVMRAAIPVEKRVAMAIWWLSSPLLYRKVAALFGVGIATVGRITIEVCLAIEHVLLPSTVRLGNYREVMDGFMAMGFPQCVGAVDGTHILIRPPKGRGKEFINRKDAFSIQVQGTVDHRGHFINVEAGFTGRTHDAFVFKQSSLYLAMEAGAFVPANPTININGVQVGPLILADAAYPLSRWLMKPYGGHLDDTKMAFNRVLNHCRNSVERGFGRLKSRWRCLTAPLTVSEENFIPVITACAVLHNICETKGHVLHQDLTPPEPLAIDPRRLPAEGYEDRRRREGERVRAAIAQMLAEQ